MAKATKTLQYALSYPSHYADWFTANQMLYNHVVAFYFDVINTHEGLLGLPNKEALRVLEHLTHATTDNPTPLIPLSEIADNIPAMFRRAAINAALGSARSFFASLKKWREKKAKCEAKGRKCGDRPPVAPRRWKKAVSLYSGMYKDRTRTSVMLKVWTGACWAWVKVRTLGRDEEEGYELGSPSLICKAGKWWLHAPIEKKVSSPKKIAAQLTNRETAICAVDLNLGDNIAVCTVQTVEGTILATKFIKGGKRISGFRKRQLGRVARNRSQTGTIAKGEQDNAAVWSRIRQADEALSHLVSTRIVQFAKKYDTRILVFEHLGNLKPEAGKYSKRGNATRTISSCLWAYRLVRAWHRPLYGYLDGNVRAVYSYSITLVHRVASTRHRLRMSAYRGVEEAPHF